MKKSVKHKIKQNKLSVAASGVERAKKLVFAYFNGVDANSDEFYDLCIDLGNWLSKHHGFEYPEP